MKKHPKFQRPNLAVNKRLKRSWRKPHGIDSKQRQKLKWAGAVVKIGYRSPKSQRHLHPQGKPEVLVHNMKELEKSTKDVVVRLAATLSGKTKMLMRKKAETMGLHVVN